MLLEMLQNQFVRALHELASLGQKPLRLRAMRSGPVAGEEMLDRLLLQELNRGEIRIDGVISGTESGSASHRRVASGLDRIAGKCGMVFLVIKGQMAVGVSRNMPDAEIPVGTESQGLVGCESLVNLAATRRIDHPFPAKTEIMIFRQKVIA